MKMPMLLSVALLVSVAISLVGWRKVSELKQNNQKLQAEYEQGQMSQRAELETQLQARDQEIQKLRAETQEIHKLRNESKQWRIAQTDLDKLRAANRQLQQENQQRARSQTPEPAPAPAEPNAVDYFGKETWALAGYATPEAAFQSAVWAMSQGDPKAMLASVTPEERQRLEKEWENKSEAQVGEEGKREMSKIKGFRILERKQISEDEIVLMIYADGDGGDGKVAPMAVKRLGNEWKFAGRHRK